MEREALHEALDREVARMAAYLEDVRAALRKGPSLRLLRPWHANSLAHEIRKTCGDLASLLDELADVDRKTEENGNGI